MENSPFHSLPVPPALVYLLHQLKRHNIEYRLYGEVADANMVFVDIDQDVAALLNERDMPKDWSLISPHFLSQRAVAQGKPDPIGNADNLPEAIVIAFGDQEASGFENYSALCEQVRFLKQKSPSRLIYHSQQPPEPIQIQALIKLLISVT